MPAPGDGSVTWPDGAESAAIAAFLTALTGPPAGYRWQDDASCAGSFPDAWFPSRGDPTAMARKICRACPVKTECREYAMEHQPEDRRNDYGIWGDTSALQRHKIRKEREALAARKEGEAA